MFGLLRSVFGKGGLYPLESYVLEEVSSNLDAESKVLFQRQLDAVNKIQRLSNGKEVNLYHLSEGKADFDDSLRFPNAPDEILLASVNLLGTENGSKFKADVWLAKGRLFSITFSAAPEKIFGEGSMKTLRPLVADVKIWCDPMHLRVAESKNPIDGTHLKGWLFDLHAKGLVSNLRAPLSESERGECLARIGAKLPSDYFEVVKQTEGMVVGDCVVNGLGRIRSIVGPDANYYILAEIEGRGALALKDGTGDSELYLVNYEDDDVAKLGVSFRKAVTDLLKLG